ncbi:MAG: GTPase Era [Gammaproteobacteria bacterium]|nr:GTPase Era [Gammaproteobacteria bacterium]
MNQAKSGSSSTRCGTVAIVGRPNVGKSTLLNRLVGQKLSITAHKPQTTRHAIVGISTTENIQAIYVDTPGIHLQGKRALNQVLNRTAASALFDVDAIILVAQALVWNEDDQRAHDLVAASGIAYFIAVNKVDDVADKDSLLPYLAKLPQGEHLCEIMPISARKGTAVDALASAVQQRLPEAEFQFAEDELTDRSSRFLAAESVREQLTRFLSNELPYAISVEIEKFDEEPGLLRIAAVIWVEKASQKGIVIGKQGERLKETGTRARKSMETLFGCKVHLQLWVKIKEGWADDERALRSLGYTTDN